MSGETKYFTNIHIYTACYCHRALMLPASMSTDLAGNIGGVLILTHQTSWKVMVFTPNYIIIMFQQKHSVS